ncbi:hypothetical protein ACFQ1M_11440 [Sungkyunkwania multivorans]|uniref:Uncharacterized protein n=1 Tax=Sungkyunkwania multivorans TaxID=1173618 RepID=A0ABW3D1W0_9FLAO
MADFPIAAAVSRSGCFAWQRNPRPRFRSFGRNKKGHVEHGRLFNCSSGLAIGMFCMAKESPTTL